MRNRAILGLLAAAALYAQKPDPNVTFEVASVKVPPPRVLKGPTRMGCSGGPGSTDPGRFSCTNGMPVELVRLAFDLKPYQLVASNLAGISSSFSVQVGETYQQGFDIEAKVPAGTTPEHFRTMLQNLLIDRFKLAYHFEKKSSDAYDLLIAKNGPKLKAADQQPDPSMAEPAPASSSAGQPPKMGANGCPIPTRLRGTVALQMGIGSSICAGGTAAPISELASFLSRIVGHTVDDATGLKGLFDISLGFTRTSPEASVGGETLPDENVIGGGADIFTAIQQQLGLRLEKKKGSLDLFLIDHLEQVPTQN